MADADYWRLHAIRNKQFADSMLSRVDDVLKDIGMGSADRAYVRERLEATYGRPIAALPPAPLRNDAKIVAENKEKSR